MEPGQNKEFRFIEDLARELASKKLIFPTSLNATLRIRSALNDPNAPIQKIVEIVRSEPVLCAQLLRLANTVAFCNGNRPVTDLSTAVRRLGYVLVRNVAIAVGMRQLADATPQNGMRQRLETVWQHSAMVAALSYTLAKRLTPHINPDSAMLAGLLHDIGKFYILSRIDHYPTLFSDDEAIERLINEWHTEISSTILESWEVPQSITTAARDHEQTQRVHYSPADLTDIVMVANLLAIQDKACCCTEDCTLQGVPAAADQLKLLAENCSALLNECREEASQIAHALS
jgi:putative nucleotidyltransferase with HDIG domain